MSVRGTDAGYQPGSAEPFGPNKKRVMQPKSLHRVGIGKKPVFCFTQTKIGVSGALGRKKQLWESRSEKFDVSRGTPLVAGARRKKDRFFLRRKNWRQEDNSVYISISIMHDIDSISIDSAIPG